MVKVNQHNGPVGDRFCPPPPSMACSDYSTRIIPVCRCFLFVGPYYCCEGRYHVRKRYDVICDMIRKVVYSKTIVWL